MFIFLILMSVSAMSQENMFTLGGGYSFATIEDTDIKGTGFRINGLYEFNPMGGKFAHGVSFGFISLQATEGETNAVEYKINSFPLYYAPKLMFGSEKINAFVKGAIGMQFASINKDGLASLEDNDFGFYGGGGAGVMLFLNEKIFINAEYEIAWASNSWYKDGWMNTAGGGLGIRF